MQPMLLRLFLSLDQMRHLDFEWQGSKAEHEAGDFLCQEFERIGLTNTHKEKVMI